VIAEALLAVAATTEPRSTPVALPARIQRIVLHTPGGPEYGRPEWRFRFFTPPETQALWAPRLGTQWILWTDGSFWPRRPRSPSTRSWLPPAGAPSRALLRRIAREAAPVYAHAYGANADSVGIEIAHSGRARDPFAPEPIRSLAWLLRTLFEMSDGRLGPADVVGHKDVDTRRATVDDACDGVACPFYADEAGAAYRRRVDPPEALFQALAEHGIRIPRPDGDLDAELRRAEAMPAGFTPKVVNP
jgi:hypothetical protein